MRRLHKNAGRSEDTALEEASALLTARDKHEDPETLALAIKMKNARKSIFAMWNTDMPPLMERHNWTLQPEAQARIDAGYTRTWEFREIFRAWEIVGGDVFRHLNDVEECRDALIEKYAKTVPFMVGKVLEEDERKYFDVMSDASFRLFEGTELYDHERDMKYISYACFVIRRAMTNSLKKKDAYTTTSPSRQLQWSKRHVTAVGLGDANHRDVSETRRLGILSYDQILTGLEKRDERMPFLELCTDPRDVEPVEVLEPEENAEINRHFGHLGIQGVRSQIFHLARFLTERERLVVALRMGLYDMIEEFAPSWAEKVEQKMNELPNIGAFSKSDGLTYEQVGHCVGVTLERVRQIFTRAMRRLKKRVEIEGR